MVGNAPSYIVLGRHLRGERSSLNSKPKTQNRNRRIPLPAAWFLPKLAQRTIGAVDGIGVRNRQRSNVLIRLWTFAWPAPEQIPLPPFWISAHDFEISAGSKVLVADSCRDYDCVTRLDGKVLALLSPESYSCGTATDAEHFMTDTVIM